MLDILFKQLSQRLRGENDLSDITWAVAKACPVFQWVFLRFFFDDIEEDTILLDFKREHADGGCRPDFYIRTQERKYVIECKISDRNHHFDDYRKQFPDARIGYITNYSEPLRSGFEMRTWEGFKKHLDAVIEKLPDGEDKNMIDGYLQYLINVCAIFQLKKMNLTSLTSLYQFNRMVEKVVNSIENHESVVYGPPKSFDEVRSGRYFLLKKGPNKEIYPWLGIYYKDDISIYMEFDASYCAPVFQSLNLEKFITDGQYYRVPYKDDYYDNEAICFELKRSQFDRFNQDATTVEEQEDILRQFMKEVLTQVAPAWDQSNGNG